MATTNGGNINFKVNMEVDKSGLNQILKPLKDIQNELNSLSASNGLTKSFEEAAYSAKNLQSIINSSWNNKLKQLNLDKFNQSIKNSYGSMSQLKNSLAGAGASGQAAFNTIASQVLNTNLQLKESNKLLDDMATSMSNTVKWGITSSIFNSITGAIQKAYYYSKDLNSSLNDIRIVTGDSVEKMERFAKSANEASKNLGRSTLDYTNAALSFYQQGLSDQEVQARTQVALKAQNITGVGTEMVDYLTAVWNGFHINAKNTEEIVDKLAKVADSSASDMSQLAVAMSKVASTANVMGVDVDQLTAQLATVIATTRQAPEAVGTAFKTIYTRLNDIKTGADEAEVSLGKYSGVMASLGFNVLDANGRLRDTGQVMQEIGSQWNKLSRQQQVYLAQTMGGLRQVNQLMSLFENWATYSELLNDSLTAQGSLNQKNNIYLESTVAHIKELRAESERTYDILLDTDTINIFVDALNGALSIFNDYIEGIGGGINVFLNFGSIVAGVFNKQISQSIIEAEQNFQKFKSNLNSSKIKQDTIKAIKENLSVNNASQGIYLDDSALLAQAEAAEKTLKVQKGLTIEQQKQAVNLQKQIGLSQQKINNLQKEKQTAQSIVATLEQEQIIKGKSLNLLNAEQKNLQYSYNLNQKSLTVLEQMQGVFKKFSSTPLSEYVKTNLIEELYEQIDNLHDVWMALGLDEKEFDKNLNIIFESIDNSNIATQDFKDAWEAIKNITAQYANDQKNDLQKINAYLKNINVDTSKSIELEKQRRNILSEQNDIIVKQGKHVINLQNLIKGLSVTGQVLTSISGSISAYLKEGATAAEKANAVYSGISGTFSSLLYAIPGIGPGLSMITRAGFGIAQSFLKASGAFQKFEQRFKSDSEKIEELKQKTIQANSQIAANNKTISFLKSLEQEWNALSGHAGNYGSTLKNLSEEEQKRYHQLVDIFSEYNESIIKGYDAQGEKIVDNNSALEKTIELIEKQQSLQLTSIYGDDLNKVFTTADLDIQTKKDNYEYLKGEKEAYEKQLDGVKEQNQKWLQTTFNGDQAELARELISEIEQKVYHDLHQFEIYDTSDQEQIDNLNNYIQGELQKEPGWGEKNFLDWFFEIRDEEEYLKPEKMQEYIEDFKIFNKVITTALNDSAYSTKGLKTSYEEWSIDSSDAFLGLQTILDIPANNLEDLQEKIDYTSSQLAVAETELNEAKFPADLIVSFLQTYPGLNEQWKAIATDENSAELTALLYNYIDSLVPDLGNTDIIDDSQSKAASSIQALQFARKFLTQLKDYYDDVEDQLQKATNDANLENFQGNSEEYEAKIIEIIQNVINNLDEDLLNDESKRKNLISIFSNFFNLSDIEFDDEFNVKSITTNLKNSVSDVKKQIEDTLKNLFGYDNFSIDESFLKAIFNFNTEDVSDIVSSLNWGSFLKYVNEGKSGIEALKQVVADYRKELEVPQFSYSEFDHDLVFNTDNSLIDKLLQNKKLTEEQLAFLNQIESQSSQLSKEAKSLGWAGVEDLYDLSELAEGGRSDQEYITNLRSFLSYVQGQYQAQFEKAKKDNESQRASLQAIINSNATEEQKAIAQNQLEENTKQGIRIERAQAKIAEDKRKKQQADEEQKWQEAITEAEAQMAMPNAIEDIIKLLKDKQSLSADQISTLFKLESDDNNLKEIAQKEGSIYTDNYIAALQQQLSLQQDLAQQSKQKAISVYQEQEARIAEQIASLQAQNENQKYTEADYNYAKALVSIGDQSPTLVNIIKEYQQWVARTEKIKELQEQILQIQEKEYALNIEEPEEEEAPAATILQLAESFNKLKQSLAEGKELTQQESQSLNDVFDLIINKYPQLEWSTSKLTKTWLAGTDSYKEALKEVEQALEQIVYEDLLNQSDQTLDKITAVLITKVDSEDFDEWVQEVQDFLSLDRQLSIQVKTNTDEQFDHLSDELDNIYKTASKIGENFTVSSIEDLKSLNEVFPGILEGIQLLEDGTYQLNSNIAQQAISTAQGTIDADATAVKAQLQNQATLFRAKASIYREIGDAAAELADKEMISEEQSNAFRTDLSDKLSKVQRINSQLVKKQQKKDFIQSANAALDSAQQQVEYKQKSTERQIELSDERKNAQVDNRNTQALAAKNASQGKMTAKTPNHTISSTNQFIGEPMTSDDSSQTSNFDELVGSALAGQILTKQQRQALRDSAYDQAAFYEKMADDFMDASLMINLNSQRLKIGLNNIISGKDIKGKFTEQKTTKDSTPGHIDLLTDITDIYHTLDGYLKKIGKDLSFIESQQKKLTDKNLLNNLKAQYDILNKQIKAYESKIKLAKQQSDILRSSLAAEGVEFNLETGAISNYVAVLSTKRAEVNKIISHYNSLSKEQQETYKQVVEDAKKDYQKFKDNLDNYDKIINETLPELRNSIQTARDEQIELAIKNFKIKVDVALDLSQATRNWNKFKKTVINQTRDDNIVGNIQSQIDDFFSYYNIEGISTIGILTDQVNKTIDQIRQINTTGTSSVYGDNKAQAIQDLQSYANSLMTSLEDIETIINNVKQSFFDVVSKAQSAFDEQKKELEFINKLIDHDKKLIQMVYGKDSYDKMDLFYQKQKQNDVRSLRTAAAQKDFWWEQLQIQKTKMQGLDKTSNAYKEAEDRLKDLEDHWISAVNNFNSTLQTSLSNLTDQYKNKLNEIFKNLNYKLTNGKGLDSVSEEWEFIKKENSLYLDDADTLYQVNKFANNFNKIFNNNSKNLRVQRSLSKVYDEQLKYLANKERLTQYDVDRATKILQIQEKRLALEQIRQNKTRLRLRRDSQGNYSYQYVADQDEILKAIQELDDAKHDLFVLDKEQYRKNLDDIYQLYSDFQKELHELYEQEPVNTEHRQQREKEIRERYGGLINKLTEDNTNVRKNLEQSTFNAIVAGIQRINDDSHTSAVYRTNLQDDTLIELFQLYDNYYAKRKAALEQQLRDGVISQQEYNERVKQLEDQALGHSISTYQLNKNAFSDMSQDMKNKIMNIIVPEWDSGIQHMVDVFVGNGGFEPTCRQAFEELTSAAHLYEQGIHDLAIAGRLDLESLGKGLDDNIGKTETLLRDTDQLFNEYRNEINTVQTLIDKLGDLVAKYNAVKQAAIDAAAQAQRLLTAQAQTTIQAAETQETMHLIDDSSSSTPSTTTTTTSEGLASPSTSSNPSDIVTILDTQGLASSSTPSNPSDIVTILDTQGLTSPTTNDVVVIPSLEEIIEGVAGAIWFFRGAAGWGDDPFRANKLTEKFNPQLAQRIQDYINLHAENGDLYARFKDNQDYLHKFFYQRFDTGGYTGVWQGANAEMGKLAILHQKELVLNKTDTENILQSVKLVRSLSENLQNRLLDSFMGFSDSIKYLMQKIGNQIVYNGHTNDLQTVYITAEFPSVNTSKQIQMAFSDLTNRASQYISSTTRKRRDVMK